MSNSLRVRWTGCAALCDPALDRLQADFADLDGSVFGAGRSADAAYGGADAGDQFANAEGLGHVVVGAEIEGFHLVFLLVAHGEHEHGQAGSKSADAAQRFNAADAGHIDVEQDTTSKLLARSSLQRLFAARGLGHLKAELNQRGAQGPADGRFVVDNKNANGRLVHDDCPFLR